MIEQILEQLNNFLWGWPLILFFMAVGSIATVMLGFFQIRYFGKAWRLLLATMYEEKKEDAEISPIQAFLNVLSTNIGNGSLAGMATAIYSGGPGAAFWVFVIGFFGLIIRFCEVYLADVQTEKIQGSVLGGPMIYLQKLPAGKYIATIYTVFLLMLAFLMGNAMQTNSIRLSLERTTGVSPYVVAAGVVAFMIYVMVGGARRILRASDIIMPFKVGLYFFSATYVLLYHWSNIIPALKLIVTSALSPQAIAGGALGYSVLAAFRFGMARSLNATESGLGTASVLFGSTGSNRPVESGLVAMTSSFISNYLVCFMLMLIIIASGVWDNGQTSSDLTISAFQTAFGSWGGWIVTSLSIIFGIGVLISYAFIGREAWKYLTNGKYLTIYSIAYVGFAAFGALASVGAIWALCDVVVAGLMLINVFGILWLLPEIKRGVSQWQKAQK